MDFKYKAKNLQGNIQTGIVKASDESVAMETLKKNDLNVFHLEPAADEGPLNSLMEKINKVSQKDLVVFSRQLAILIDSKVPIVRSLRTIADQAGNKVMGNICLKMATTVEEGSSLSEALEEHSAQFDRFFVSVIRSGESSGNLQHSLNYLADHVEKAYELQRKIKSAMMYPGVILTAFVAIFFFLTVKVLPQLTTILKESNVDLPWTTQIIIVVSDFMAANWLAMLIAFIGSMIGLIYYFRTEAGKENMDMIVLKIPIIGTVVQYSYIALFAENLGVLLKEGVSIVKSLRIMSEVMGNVVYRRLMVKIMKGVEKGRSMTEGMTENEEAFPKMVPQMIKIGEEAGRTSEILENIENFYTKEVNNLTENLTAIIEPLLIIVLGVGTGILVAAIIMPIYDMAGSM
ncbi:MAG: type II secretion system F family protein [Patescibacteria group bacterium]|nr:type II secretion system F family protein [Patescibacteria group bacterium]